jgi:multidrug efflux system outer membrane protein
VKRVLLGLPLLAGCQLGPDYARPDLAPPEAWHADGGERTASLAELSWWQLFDAPELVRLIETALAENQDLGLALERVQVARARLGLARADQFPRLDLSAGAARIDASETGLPPLPAGADDQSSLYALTATASWELDLFGRLRRASEAELARLRSAEFTHRAVALALVAAVAQAYVELVDLDERLAIARRTLESRRATVELARVRFEGGRTSELDWRQAEAEAFRTEALVHDFEGLAARAENALALLLGGNPGPIERGAALAFEDVPALPAGLPSELLERRPDVRAAEEELAAATAEIGAARALLFPRVALTGDFGQESSVLGDLLQAPARAWSLGANLLQPIFDAGRNRRGIELAESAQRQALLAYERSVRSALRDVEDALVERRRAARRRAAELQRVTAERKVLELADLRYQGGVAAYFEVLDAQRSLFLAELDEASARRDELVAVVRLYKSLGGGWSASVDAESR